MRLTIASDSPRMGCCHCETFGIVNWTQFRSFFSTTIPIKKTRCSDSGNWLEFALRPTDPNSSRTASKVTRAAAVSGILWK